MDCIPLIKKKFSWGWLAPMGLVLGVAWLWWMAWGDERIQFLPEGGAAWIVYPTPFNGETIPVVELPADFHRSFALERKPEKATLEWRCFRSGKVMINGQVVEAEEKTNWKRWSRADVAGFLRAGTNEIEVVANAAMGPPAISVRLNVGDVRVETDEAWDVSEAGALRLPARLAGAGPENLPSTEALGGGRVRAAMGRLWGYEVLFLAAGAGGAWFLRRRFNWRLVAMGLAAAWVILLVHNICFLRFYVGFDASAHIRYIEFIEKTGTLPRADQGWEMFQAPLYYAVAGGVLRLAGCEAFSPPAMIWLRVFNLLAGAANVGLVFWGMKMLFPANRKKQGLGTALGAFTPCQMYLLHYTTNEVLMATLGTATLALCLKCLQTEPSAMRWRVGLGAALGAACSTKASAMVLLPVVFAALGAQLLTRRERAPGVWLRTFGIVGGMTAALGGWHYWRLAREFGTPLAGFWTRGGRKAWWQQAGCSTGHDFLSFGKSLTAPYFSGFHSFWDGLYSTWWGDGLWGGSLQHGRTLWNEEFMTVGFALALPLAGVIATGTAVSLVRWMRRPDAEGIWLLGPPMTYLFAVAVMAMKLPNYEQAKSFYALPALLPICALGVAGWEFWAGRSRAVGVCLVALAGAWWLNNCAAFWIRPDSAQFRLTRALAEYHVPSMDAAGDFQKVLEVDPHNAVAQLYAALLEREAGRMDRFAEELAKARADHPDDAQICALQGDYDARRGDWGSALRLAERAARLAPDDYAVALSWMRFAREQKRFGDVVKAGELVLRDRPHLREAHQAMAEALTQLGQPAEAAMHEKIAEALSNQ